MLSNLFVLKLKWNTKIRPISKDYRRMVDILNRSREYLTPAIMLYLYKTHIRPPVSGEQASAPKDLCRSLWWRRSICYDCTGPHKVEMHVKKFSPDVAVLFSLLRAGFTPAESFRINHVSSLSDRWWCLPSSRSPCPSPSCHLCRRSWSADAIALVTACRWPVCHTDGPSGSSYQ